MTRIPGRHKKKFYLKLHRVGKSNSSLYQSERSQTSFDLSKPMTQSIKLLLFSKNLLVRKRFVAKYGSKKIVDEILNLLLQFTFTYQTSILSCTYS